MNRTDEFNMSSNGFPKTDTVLRYSIKLINWIFRETSNNLSCLIKREK